MRDRPAHVPDGPGAIASIEGAVLGYGRRPAVKVDRLRISADEIVLLSGENGAGKSSVLRALIGEAAAIRGTVTVCQARVGKLGCRQDFLSRISYKPQEAAVFDPLTVREHLRLGTRFRSAGQSGDWQAQLERALTSRLNQDSCAGTLSGGERQWLALVMSLFSGTRLLMLDEPLAEMAPDWAQDAVDLIRQHHLHWRGACLIVEHRTEYLSSLRAREMHIEVGADDVGQLIAGV